MPKPNRTKHPLYLQPLKTPTTLNNPDTFYISDKRNKDTCLNCNKPFCKKGKCELIKTEK